MTNIIICARNEEATIGSVVRSCVNANVGRVYVVDDCSLDNTAVIARNCGAYVVNGPSRGKGAAMMCGLRFATSHRVAFVDADLVGVTSAHITALTNDNGGVIVGYRDNASWMLSRLPPISGERCMPTAIARSVNLSGYGAESQLNAAVADAGLPVDKILLHGVTTTTNYLGPWRLVTIAPHALPHLPSLIRYAAATRQRWTEQARTASQEHSQHVQPYSAVTS
jgi:polyisoprenyl-phosphate glycosyltransferase